MAKKYIIDLLVNADGSVKSVNGVKGAITSLQQTADKATGGMITKFANFGKSIGGVTKGIGGTSKALKILKTALVSTGVGAIVVAFGSLVTFLTSTQRGMDKVSKATAALGATFDVLRDRLSTVGEAVSLLFSGDWDGFKEKVSGAFKGITQEIINETKAAYDLKDALLALEDTEIDLIATTAERRKEIAKARLAAEDETKTISERIKALDDAAKLETDILNEQLRIAKERARISAEQVALGESSRDEIKENAELQAAVFQLEERSLLLQKSLSTRRNALIRQEEAERKRILEERKVEALDVSALAVQETEEKISLTDLVAQKNAEFAEQQKLNAEQELATQQMLDNAKRQSVDLAIGLFGAETAAGKAALIAKQVMAAQELIQEAKSTISFASMAGARSSASIAEGTAKTARIGFPQNIPMLIGYALQAAGIIKAISGAISQSKSVAGSAGGVSGGRTPSIQAPNVGGGASQPPAFNIVGSAGTNQLAEAIGGQAKQPTRAYVVSQDVTTAQSLERNIVEGASI